MASARNLIEAYHWPSSEPPNVPDGWMWVDTGGGCTGLQRDIDGGKYWLITDGDSQAPLDHREPCVLSLCYADGTMRYWDMPNVDAAVKLTLGRARGADILPED